MSLSFVFLLAVLTITYNFYISFLPSFLCLICSNIVPKRLNLSPKFFCHR